MTSEINIIKELLIHIDELYRSFNSELYPKFNIKINFKRKTIKNLVEDEIIYKNFFTLYEESHTLNRLFISNDRFNKLFKIVKNKEFSYRYKNSKSLIDKINRNYNGREQGSIPIIKILNDLFAMRLITDKKYYSYLDGKGDINKELLKVLEDLQSLQIVSRFYLRVRGNYKAIHIYLKAASNYNLPWELQRWYRGDKDPNYKSHKDHKQEYLKEEG